MNTRTRVSKKAYALTEEIDWESAYKEYLPRVYNFFHYRVNDQLLAEDLTAATFEKAWRGRARFHRDLSTFSTWLFTIARNVAIDYYRKRAKDMPLDTARDQADAVSVEETVQHQREFARLSELLSQLPARASELIALKYGAGLTNREIARLTHLSESNVGTLVARVVEKLRLKMEVKP